MSDTKQSTPDQPANRSTENQPTKQTRTRRPGQSQGTAGRQLRAIQETRRMYIAINREQERLVAINVRNEDLTGDYFSVPLVGTPTELIEQALEIAVSTAPNYCRLYIHTQDEQLRDALRENTTPGSRKLSRILYNRNIALRSGSIIRLEGFWQDLLLSLGSDSMPAVQILSNRVLYTYGISDGHQSLAGGVLYGEGQIHTKTICTPEPHIAPVELELAAWAMELLGPGKSIELCHHHPEANEFWDTDATTFIQRYPSISTVAKRITAAIERRDLRFDLHNLQGENTISRAVRDLAGRSLRDLTGYSPRQA